MKKIISLIAAASIAASMAIPVLAGDNAHALYDENTAADQIYTDRNPEVFINGAKVYFEDQKSVISNDITLVPVRGIFEAMDAKVSWDQETQTAKIQSEDNFTRVMITIGNKTMTIYHFKNIFSADEELVELDTAPIILGDRTMVPLRAISEALDADVQWDEAANSVYINTLTEEEKNADKLSLTLSADKETVAEGETVNLYIDAANIEKLYPDSFVSGVTATITYDPDNFELTDGALLNGDTKVEGALGVSNPLFTEDSAKFAYVTIDKEIAAKQDGKIFVASFKSLNGQTGSFSISADYDTRLGYNTVILLNQNNKDVEVEGTELNIDTTPVVINKQ